MKFSKKILWLGLILALAASAFGAQLSPARAAGPITYDGVQYVTGVGVLFRFQAEGFRNKDLKDATIYVGGDYYPLSCWAHPEDGYVLCSLPGGMTEFAGQTGIIYLGGYMFYVVIPGRSNGETEDQSLTCSEGVPGADVTFFTSNETLETFFVAGATLSEVQSNAESWLGDALIDIEEIGDLYCGQEPT